MVDSWKLEGDARDWRIDGRGVLHNASGVCVLMADPRNDIALSGFATLLVKTVGDCSGGRLVDDTENLKTSNSASILSCLALGVIEVWMLN